MPGKSKSNSTKGGKQSSRSLSSFFGFSKRNKRSDGTEKYVEKNNNSKSQCSEPVKHVTNSNNTYHSLDRKLLNRKNQKKLSSDKNEVIQKYDLTASVGGSQNTHCSGTENGSSSSDEPSNHISARGLQRHLQDCKCESKEGMKEKSEKLNSKNSLTNLQLKLNGSKNAKNIHKMINRKLSLTTQNQEQGLDTSLTSAHGSVPNFRKISTTTKTIVLNSTFTSSPQLQKRVKENRFHRQHSVIAVRNTEEGRRRNDYSRKYSLPQQRKKSLELNYKNIQKASPIVLKKFSSPAIECAKLFEIGSENSLKTIETSSDSDVPRSEDSGEKNKNKDVHEIFVNKLFSNIDTREHPIEKDDKKYDGEKENVSASKNTNNEQRGKYKVKYKRSEALLVNGDQSANLAIGDKGNIPKRTPTKMKEKHYQDETNLNHLVDIVLQPELNGNGSTYCNDSKTAKDHGQSINNAITFSVAKDFHLKDLEILVTLGTGTFGRVFLVEDRTQQQGNEKDEATEKPYAMKVMKIHDIIRLDQIEHVNSEKKILELVQHAFIVQCHFTARDDKCLYMLFEYVQGGELFTYLRNKGRFTSDDTKFYISEIICVLGYLHEMNIVYRDLKPENLLLDHEGHLKFTDFGFAKVVEDITWTLCGTPEYLSPEAVLGKGYDSSCDWWALGVLTFEMLVGEAPFVDSNSFILFQKILSGVINWPSFLKNTPEQDFIQQLVVERSERLGQRKGLEGAAEVKNHPLFDDVIWNDVENRRTKPPIIPKLAFQSDTSNFDDFDETFDINSGPEIPQNIKHKFRDWLYEL